MYLTQEEKGELFAKHGKDSKDSGSAEGQIALMTGRIEFISQHLKRKQKKIINSERSLVKLVGKRRNLLDYLMKNIL